MGIEFAPLVVPMAQRLQTLAAFAVFVVFVLPGLIPYTFLGLLYVLFFTQYYWIALIYVAFCFHERNIAQRGGRPSNWVRNWRWWHYFRDFFPIKLVKTTDLDASKNYLFAAFPHGMICAGATTCFGTEALNVSKVLPGITPYMITLGPNFIVPLFRELILGMGCCSSSTKSLSYLLSKPSGGNAAVLAIGGAAEALMSKPRTYRIFLKHRKGFIKIALRNGASLVPVFSFGEPDMYDQMEGKWLLWAQNIIRKSLGYAPLVLMGRGFFQYSFGVIPKRSPVTTVVGAPIHVNKIEDPTSEQINALHQQFMDSLISLFETEKHKYLEKAKDTKLEIF